MSAWWEKTPGHPVSQRRAHPHGNPHERRLHARRADRLGVPALLMRDASLGVTNPGFREGDMATALPAGIVLDASFDLGSPGAWPHVGLEARSRGFNVLLAGGINLARTQQRTQFRAPIRRSAAECSARRGVDQRHPGRRVISRIKHYSLNCNETNRHWLDAIIDPAAIANPTCWRSRSRSSARSRARYVRLQQDQWRLRGWQQPPARGRAQGRMGYPDG